MTGIKFQGFMNGLRTVWSFYYFDDLSNGEAQVVLTSILIPMGYYIPDVVLMILS